MDRTAFYTENYEGTPDEVIERILLGLALNRRAGPIAQWAGKMMVVDLEDGDSIVRY